MTKKTVSVRMFSHSTIPIKYKEEILQSGFCARGDKVGISLNWLEFQMSRAPMIVICLENREVKAFLFGFNYNKDERTPDDETEEEEMARHKMSKEWTLDTICRDPDPSSKPYTALILNRFLKEAINRGIGRIGLFASTPEAATAYLKYGFKPKGKRDPDGAVHMILRL